MSTRSAQSSPGTGRPSGKLPMMPRLSALVAWFVSRSTLSALVIYLETESTGLEFADRPVGIFTRLSVVAMCELAILLFLSRHDATSRFWRSPSAFYLFNPLTLHMFLVLDTRSFVLGALLAVSFHIVESRNVRTSGVWLGISVAIEPSFLLAAIGPIMFVFLRRSRVPHETRDFVTYVLGGFVATLSLRALAENTTSIEQIWAGIGFTALLESAEIFIAFETLVPSLGFAVFLLFLKHVGHKDLAVLVVLPMLCSLLVTTEALALGIALVIALRLAIQPYGNLVWIVSSAMTWLITLIAVSDNQTSWRADYQFIWQDLLHFSEAGAAFALILVLTKHSLLQSPYRKIASRNVLILIAGDSGTGKDTLSENLAKLLGSNLTAQISGDDYHRWPRASLNWNYTTHLNVSSNYLSRFCQDVLVLVSGNSVARATYNHASGRFQPASHFSSKPFVVASGLHALRFRHLNERAELTVYLEMSENLRTTFKIARDTESRNHTLDSVTQTLKKRAPDSRKFVDPQSTSADLVVTISSRQETDTRDVSQILGFTSLPMPFDDKLIGLLQMVLGLDVRQHYWDGGRRTLQIRGFAETNLYSTCFRQLQPVFSSLSLITDDWANGPQGLIQFISALYLAENLKTGRL